MTNPGPMATPRTGQPLHSDVRHFDGIMFMLTVAKPLDIIYFRKMKNSTAYSLPAL